MNQIIILGSANAVAKIGQDNAHLLIRSAEKQIMVDCGNSPFARVSAAGGSITEITDLILTHAHADHMGNLPLLLMDMWLEKRDQMLTIHGLEITLEKARALLEVFDWQQWAGMFPIRFNRLSDTGNEGFIRGEDCVVSALPVKHLVPTIGLRIAFSDGRVMAYSCDTEPCDNVLKLAQGADILMQEAAGEAKGHTSPRQAGEIAMGAGVRKLVLIHYENRVDQDTIIAQAKNAFTGEVVLAHDLMTF